MNGFQASATYGQASTAASIANAIANILNTNGSSPVTASLSGSKLTLTAKTAGSNTNYSLLCGSSTTQGSFSSPSFTISCDPTLTGGRDAGSGNKYYYFEDMLGSSRTLVQAGQTNPCYDADFYPFGGERVITSTCPQNYQFEGKERDSETGNDDFGARYYSSRFGRWLSADWSAVPTPVPYANLMNPQTLNLYAMVSDNPETFADLDGHINTAVSSVFGDPANGGACVVGDPTCEAEQQKATAPPPPQNQLSVADVTKIIQQAQKSSSDPASTAFNIFNGLGNNASVTGNTLRQAVKETGIRLDGAAADLISNASGITKSGNNVTITSSSKYDTSQSGITIHVDARVSFSVGLDKGLPGISNIKGLRAEVGVNANVDRMQVATRGDKKVLLVTGSKAIFHKTVEVPLE